MHTPIRLLSIIEVGSALGLRKTALQQRILAGLLTNGITINSRVVRWPSHEVEAITEAIACGLTDDQIRQLVSRLHAARTHRAAELLAA